MFSITLGLVVLGVIIVVVGIGVAMGVVIVASDRRHNDP